MCVSFFLHRFDSVETVTIESCGGGVPKSRAVLCNSLAPIIESHKEQVRCGVHQRNIRTPAMIESSERTRASKRVFNGPRIIILLVAARPEESVDTQYFDKLSIIPQTVSFLFVYVPKWKFLILTAPPADCLLLCMLVVVVGRWVD